MNKINWWAIACLVLLLALVINACSLLGLGWWGYGHDWGRSSRWSYGCDWGRSSGWRQWKPEMTGDWWIRQITFLSFSCLMPALFITLLVIGIVWLVKAVSAPDRQC
jgi:hypothetical protein